MQEKRAESNAPLIKWCSLSKTAEKADCVMPQHCLTTCAKPCSQDRASPDQPTAVPCTCNQRQCQSLRVAALHCSWKCYMLYTFLLCIHKNQEQAALTQPRRGWQWHPSCSSLSNLSEPTAGRHSSKKHGKVLQCSGKTHFTKFTCMFLLNRSIMLIFFPTGIFSPLGQSTSTNF